MAMIKVLMFIAIHMVVFAGILSLGFLGFSPYRVIAASIAAFSLEAVLVALYFGAKLKRTASSLKNVESAVSRFKDSEDMEERIHRELLYLGHQIKTLQSQMDAFKKIGLLKINGNGHHKSVHI